MITEYEEYVKNNDRVLGRFKDQSLRIVGAFIKAGANLERDVYPYMKYKALYMPQFHDQQEIDKPGGSRDTESESFFAGSAGGGLFGPPLGVRGEPQEMKMSEQ